MIGEFAQEDLWTQKVQGYNGEDETVYGEVHVMGGWTSMSVDCFK